MVQQQQRQQVWVRRFEHAVLRFCSLGLSVVSANSVLWFYSSMDSIPGAVFFQPYVKWVLAVVVALFGYFASRGLAHRLLNRERVGVYIFICVVLELIEVSTSFMQAAVAIHNIEWLGLFSGGFRAFLFFLVYVVMPVFPVLTVVFAWVDMDLERKKTGVSFAGLGGSMRQAQGVPVIAAAPKAAAQSPAAAAAPSSNRGYGAPGQSSPNVPPRLASSKAPDTQYGKAGGFQFPFPRRGGGNGGDAQPAPVVNGNGNGYAASMLHDPDKFAVVE